MGIPVIDAEECAARAAAVFLSRLHVAATSEPRVRMGRSVRISNDVQVHEVTPYSEVYGLHPREFVFGKFFCLIPAAGPFGFVGIGEESQDSSEVDDVDSDVTDDDDDLLF